LNPYIKKSRVRINESVKKSICINVPFYILASRAEVLVTPVKFVFLMQINLPSKVPAVAFPLMEHSEMIRL
jgi:hypothetical protein